MSMLQQTSNVNLVSVDFMTLLSMFNTRDEDQIKEYLDTHLQSKSGHSQLKTILEYILQSNLSNSIIASLIKHVVKFHVSSVGDPAVVLSDSCALHIASYVGFPEVVEHLLSWGCQVTHMCKRHRLLPIFEAARGGHELIIDLLLKNGASVDIHDSCNPMETPLTVALKNHSNKAALHKLVSAQKKYQPCPIRGDCGGQHSILLCAAGWGSVSGVDVLLHHGGLDVNWQSDCGDTALITAAAADQPAVLQFLLKYPGIDLDLQNSEGHTALHLAPSFEILKPLVDSGADLCIRDNEGKTVLSINIDNGDVDCVRYLLQANCPCHVNDYENLATIQSSTQCSKFLILKMLSLSGAYLKEEHRQFEVPPCCKEISEMFKSSYDTSLKDIVRVKIRSSLRERRVQFDGRGYKSVTFRSQLEQMNLPGVLKDYLQMRDLDLLKPDIQK